jgi:hypothetical protein
MKLRNKEIAELFSGLQKLDGIINDEKVSYFKFKPKAAWAIARNLRGMKTWAEEFESEKEDIVKKHNGGKTAKVIKQDEIGEEAFASIEADLQESSNRETEIKVLTVEASDLDLENNQIPPVVLASIAVMVVDFDDTEG